MIKYRTWYNEEIEQVKVKRETEKYLILENRGRTAKTSNHENYFDTWKEAHEFLLARSNKKIDVLESQLRTETEKRDLIKEMKERTG